MSAPPLTHHEILELVEPFTRQGVQVDLGASDRVERRLVFRAVVHAAAGEPEIRDVLQLQSLGTGTFRLTRSLSSALGATATIAASGTRPAQLLEAVRAVDPHASFSVGDGYVLARSYRLESSGSGLSARQGAAQWVLTQGVAQLAGLTLTMNVASTRGVSADLTLRASAGDGFELPPDLLAVLGWNWTRLVPDARGWTSKLRLPGSPARRRRAAEGALQRVAQHLARTLAQAPAQFHDRHRWARWGAALRRGIPLLTALCLTVAVLALPRVSVQRTPGLWVLFFHVPVVLIALSFSLQDLSRLEIPPWPRRDAAPTWQRRRRHTPPAAGAAQPHGDHVGG